MFDANVHGEHIELTSWDTEREPAAAVRLQETIELHDPLRRKALTLALFEEGVVELRSRRGGRTERTLRLDLKHLDPTPIVTRQIAKRTLLAAGCAAGVAMLLGALAGLVASPVAALGACAVTSAVVAAACLLVAARRSGETISFVSLNGRVPVLELSAAFGALRRLRSAVPRIAAAIERTVDESTLGTGAFLRAEMREHYRLRGERVLTEEQCATGTRRVLARFDSVR
jgi:hypothetical protein